MTKIILPSEVTFIVASWNRGETEYRVQVAYQNVVYHFAFQRSQFQGLATEEQLLAAAIAQLEK